MQRRETGAERPWQTMNGFGVGLTVGIGIIIAMILQSPGLQASEAIMTVLFWSFMIGLIFELYRLAFSWKHPFRR